MKKRIVLYILIGILVLCLSFGIGAFIIINTSYKENETSYNTDNTTFTGKEVLYSIKYTIPKNYTKKEKNDYIYYYPEEVGSSPLYMVYSCQFDNSNVNNDDIIKSFLDGMIGGGASIISSESKIIKDNEYIYNHYTTPKNEKIIDNYAYITMYENRIYCFVFGQYDKAEEKYLDVLDNIIDSIDIEKVKQTSTATPTESPEEKAERIEREKNNFISNCNEYTYKEIARNPDNYIDVPVKFTGEVIQTSEHKTSYSNNVTIRLNITQNEYGWYEDTIYCTYSYEKGESKILEDDIITIYGICKGETSYTSTMGAIITLPKVEIKYFTIDE